VPLLTGWGSNDRTVLWHVHRGLRAVERELRRDGIDPPPAVARALIEIGAYLKTGSTAANAVTSHSDTLGQVPAMEMGSFETMDSASAARIMGCSERTVRRMCVRGDLPAVMAGGSYQIDKLALEAKRKERAQI
jgi:excisionase family DNA binding protein